ncbi:uncharacterized protein CMU_014580 [Cryptosporidium muris RN66]|uniref:Glycosyltransferase 2-like domain-containing protein n=1 Tax=Cryptosporidium muris (strain RN66) TaxID=441375 RepID=B6AF15_CRYMR|nr:uncharacterized protein CMU_014580 [Cryptosporidium muris RN66]EEA06782.1 hypothetical protein, conserved [Cryptosporidium muris RN66]|eukprot:XP_002141131.1 hypothetical protein [Cryptosporidium muris RN66]
MKVHLGFLYIVSTIIFVYGQDSILPFLGSTRSKLDLFIKANRTRNTDINKRNELSLSYPFNFTEHMKLSNRENSLIHRIENPNNITLRGSLEKSPISDESTVSKKSVIVNDRKTLVESAWSKLLDMIENEVKTKGMVPINHYANDISVVIPVAKEDIRSLPVLLSVMRLQTLRPEEIIVVLDVSNKLDDIKHTIEDLYKKYSTTLRNLIFIYRTPEPPPSHWAASNRLFGASKAKNNIIMFFDSDDIIHPQRVEYISRVFKKNLELEAFLTGYDVITLVEAKEVDEMPNKALNMIQKRFDLDKIEESKGLLATTYQKEYEEALKARKKLNLQTPWDPHNHYSEVNRPETGTWWLYCCHNGWLNIKKNILIEVPWEDIPSGEDSLYVFRLLLSGKNVNHSDLPLGIYVLGNSY